MDPGTLRFVEEALALKDQARRGWLRAGIERPESVADHTWGVALLALVEAPARGLDVARVVRLALVHDLAEAITGDLVPGEYASRDAKQAQERAALLGMLSEAPASLRVQMLADFDELERDATAEARFVHELDKLEMGLQARRYHARGVPEKELAPFMKSARAAVDDAKLRTVLKF